MRIGSDVAVPRVVLADRGHSACPQPVVQRRSEMRDRVRIAMEGTVADHRARTVIDVEDGREAEVHAVLPELVGDRAADPHRLRLPPWPRRDPTARPAYASAGSR
jgi:hypothetical protein